MAAGIGAVAYLPTLPAALPSIAATAIVAAACAVLHHLHAPRAWRAASIAALAVALGIGWGTFYGYRVRATLLPLALEQQPLTLTGTIEGIVEQYAEAGADPPPTLRWSLRVDTCTRAQAACGVALQRVQLTAYQTALRPAGGERWRLRVALRRPRGFANPGGFDYEAWLVAQRIGAVGYVLDEHDGNRRLAAAPFASIDRWRTALKRRLDARAAQLRHVDLLAGLLIGDGSGIDAAEWDTFRATGTVHLFVVSGLQIAFTGGLALWLGRLWWRSPWGGNRRRDYGFGVLPALLAATLYALLAGFGLPIQRALIMFGCVVWALAARREIGAATWSLALLLVSLGNPLAALDTGFWFSFGAVAVMLVCAAELRRRVAMDSGNSARRLAIRLEPWWRVQTALFVGGLPLALTIGGPFTLLALPANALAVPWSTLLTMPLAFAALLFEAIAPRCAGTFWWLADLTLRALWGYLQWLQQWRDGAVWQPPGSGAFGLGCASLCAVLHLLPRGAPGRAWAWLLLLPVGWPQLPRIAPGDCRVTVVDVGQGLSVLVETSGHRLLYDTGPPFGPQRSVAELTVVPLLYRLGARRLDAVVVSHRDSDHAGGWPSIAARFDVAALWVGESLSGAQPPAPLPQPCRAGWHWRWDGVDFDMQQAPIDSVRDAVAGNNASCVVAIRAAGSTPAGATLLLPGDIERAAEYALYERLPAGVDILLAPHHGSRSSSTAAFVARTRPRYVVFSSGYRNRFGHPHAAVTERYAQAGAQLLNTADSGALIFDVQGGRVVRVERWRERLVHYWQ